MEKVYTKVNNSCSVAGGGWHPSMRRCYSFDLVLLGEGNVSSVIAFPVADEAIP